MQNPLRWGVGTVFAAAMLLAGATEPVHAQVGGDGFLFKTPSVSLGIRSGYSMPRAGSELFDFTREQLTVETSDFYSEYVGGELAIRVTDRIDLTFGAGHAASSTPSEFRDWVDTDDQPIEQTTRLSITPATVGMKYYLQDRGRSVGRFAWIPNRVSPYVGGGLGVVWYTFQQRGDFVDFQTLDIFRSTITSDGIGTQVHGLAGVDVSLNTVLYLTGEARYDVGSAELNSGFFEDFDDMDLAGLRFVVGISARF